MDTIICCGHPMGRAGKIWSGRKQVQRFRCSKCGRTTTKIPNREEVKK